MVVCGRTSFWKAPCLTVTGTVCQVHSCAHFRACSVPSHFTSELLEAFGRLLKALSEVGVQMCTADDPAQISVSYVWIVLFSG